MQFSDTTNNTGLIQDCETLTGLDYTGISGTATVLDTFIRYINQEYGIVVSKLFQQDGRWQYDDTNHTDSPTATGDLTDGTGKYDILLASPSTTQDWLVVERVDIKNENGDWVKLKPIDKADIGIAVDEYHDTDSTPLYYDWTGSQIRLFPAPNYDSTGGIKFYLKRAPLYFADTDTTKKPGFPSTHHQILSFGASFRYCVSKDMPRANSLKAMRDEMLEDLLKLFRQRDKFEKPRITRLKKRYK
ncbi:MAG: hypothetical protein V2I33_22850 [Kangiellaceae bacterium]|nr:hypothetical protein [Kangiellaceae bacterium]